MKWDGLAPARLFGNPDETREANHKKTARTNPISGRANSAQAMISQSFSSL